MHNYTKIFFILGAGFACLAVALGAFGVHGLRSLLSSDMLAIFETAVRYQMYHAFALLGVAFATQNFHLRFAQLAGRMFVTGIIFFSGSLYLLSMSGVRQFGMITPIGGVCFLAGWILLGVSAWKSTETKK